MQVTIQVLTGSNTPYSKTGQHVFPVIFVLIFTLTACSKICADESDRHFMRLAVMDQSERINKKLFSVPEPLMKIQKLLSMPEKNNLRVVRTEFMNKWARNSGRERWEMQPVYFPPETEKKIWKELDALQMVNAFKPSAKKYDFAIIFGATVPVLIRRFEYLIQLSREGIYFRNLIILTTQRPITRKEEKSTDHFKKMDSRLPCTDAMPPTTESEAAVMIYRCINMPRAMVKAPVKFYDFPRDFKALRWERPDTRDCVVGWIKDNKKHGSILAISSQPHIPYQYAVLRSELPSSYSIEVAGPKVNKAEKIEVALDALSNWLKFYNEKLENNKAVEIKKK